MNDDLPLKVTFGGEPTEAQLEEFDAYMTYEWDILLSVLKHRQLPKNHKKVIDDEAAFIETIFKHAYCAGFNALIDAEKAVRLDAEKAVRLDESFKKKLN